MARKLYTQHILERTNGYAPLRDGQARVDRTAGVIYGVKIVGRESPNSHGVRGVSGTEYTLEALEKALPLYEGINCNVDHPPREKPLQERSAHDRFSWLEKCYVTESGIYGDLHFLDPSDPLAVKMLNAAEKHPNAFALSHNAVGKGEVKAGKYVISEIPEVRSVDIVADGGTNRSLFESRTPMAKTTLRKQIVNARHIDKQVRAKLLEMAKQCSEESEKEYDEAAMEGEEEPGWKDHVTNAVGALVKSEDPKDHDRAGKLMKHLRPEEEEVEESEEGAEPEGDEDLDDESQDGRGNPEKKKGKYNDKKDSKGKESMESRERRRKALTKIAGNLNVDPDKDLLESLSRMPLEDATTILSKLPAKSNKNAPRSGPAAGQPRNVQENFDPKAWAQRMTRRAV